MQSFLNILLPDYAPISGYSHRLIQDHLRLDHKALLRDSVKAGVETEPQPRSGQMQGIALYTRVSTQNKGQETANQLLQLRECCQAQYWSVVHEYEDHDSGKATRSAFQEMLRDAAARTFDVVLFWSFDRLTREGTLATLKYLELLKSYGVRWRSLTEPWIDSAGPFRDVIISLLASLAKQERVGSQNDCVLD